MTAHKRPCQGYRDLERLGRQRFLKLLGTGVALTLAGCGSLRSIVAFSRTTLTYRSERGVSLTSTGTIPFKIDGKVIHGAAIPRLTVTGGDLTSGLEFKLDERWYFPQGSIKSVGAGKAMLQPDSTVTQNGDLTFTGGTGAFRGATGKDTFTGSQPNADATATVNDNGTISY